MQRIIDELGLQTKADKALIEQGRLTQEELNNVRLRAKKDVSNMQNQVMHLQKSLSSALSSKKKMLSLGIDTNTYSNILILILILAQEILDIEDDAEYSYNELGEGIAGRYTSPMRRYSFDDTTTGYNHNINHNNAPNNDHNMNINAIMSNNNNHNNNNNNSNSITYESPSTSPRATNDTKGINILPLLLLILILI